MRLVEVAQLEEWVLVQKQKAVQSTPLSVLSSTARLSRLPMQNRRRYGGLYFAPPMTLRMLSKRRSSSIIFQ